MGKTLINKDRGVQGDAGDTHPEAKSWKASVSHQVSKSKHNSPEELGSSHKIPHNPEPQHAQARQDRILQEETLKVKVKIHNHG